MFCVVITVGPCIVLLVALAVVNGLAGLVILIALQVTNLVFILFSLYVLTSNFVIKGMALIYLFFWKTSNCLKVTKIG
jgi:hypothetical protein